MVAKTMTDRDLLIDLLYSHSVTGNKQVEDIADEIMQYIDYDRTLLTTALRVASESLAKYEVEQIASPVGIDDEMRERFIKEYADGKYDFLMNSASKRMKNSGYSKPATDFIGGKI